MRKAIGLFLLLTLLTCLGDLSTAQTPPPPSATPQVIVVTATPGASLASGGFGEENSKLIIGAIITALVGLMSGVFLSPLLKPTFERMGDALANQLSRLGSGRGFKKRYLTHLTQEHRGLNIKGLKTRAPVTVELEQVYVSLHAQAPDKVLGRQEPPSLDVGQALGQYERLAILGGPGTGKTTLMAYLALTYGRGQAKERLGLDEKRLPILAPLRQLKAVLGGENGPSTLPAYLLDWYTRLGFYPNEDFFARALRAGKCLVLLDGLDEVADEAERRAMSGWVDSLVATYPQNRYVVTSRPPGYDSAPLQNGFTVLRIRDFTIQEIRQFANNWCLAVELAAQGGDNPTARRHARQAAQDLVSAIEANVAICKLAVNPLLLSIIALVHRYRATLPKRRVDLYAECVDVLLGHWDEAKGLAGKLSSGEKRTALQPLALQMHREERRDIPRRELQARIAQVLPKVGGEAADAAAFLDEVRERSGLLIEAGMGLYAFSHLTFQEYLCAREIMDLEMGHSNVALARQSLSELRQVLDARFDDEELRTLCVDLDVDYDDLPGRGQSAKARELTTLMERRGRLDELGQMVRAKRPGALAEAKPAQSGLDVLLAQVGDEWWQEVTLLYAGMAPATPIVEALLAGDDPDGARLLLAGRCAAEALRLDEATRERVMGRLESYFAACTGERFLETGCVLAEIAGEDSVDFFLRLAHEDAERREAALWSLGQMAGQPNETLRERVLARLMDHFGREEFEQEVGTVLLEMWEPRLVDELQLRHTSVELLEKARSLTMVRIPAGEFLYEDDKKRQSLPEYWIDKTPVTNAQYARFVEATGHKPPQHWQGKTPPQEIMAHPVVYVSWQDAVAYAEWVGKLLPTEEEWEKAARGTDRREYPWGDQEPTPDLCNFGRNIGGTTPVGQYSPAGDSPYGCVDMAGNVWKWTASDYDKKFKVLCGGSWDSDSHYVRAAARNGAVPSLRDADVGFRCMVVAPG